MRLNSHYTVGCLLAFGLLAVQAGLSQTITTVAGSGVYGFSGDNASATAAQINNAYGVAVDTQGNIFVADSWNHRVRKIAGSIITTVAGTGQEGFVGDGGTATSARLSYPRGLAVDSSGNLYIADTGNSRIRKVTSSGIISTIAGTGTAGFGGDNGPATSAILNYPRGLARDSSGNLYIADSWNYRVRKINASGTIQTIAGNGSYGPFGDGGAATSASLGLIHGLALDASGNLYLSDPYLHLVRKVTPGGTISAVVGGGYGAASDGGTALSATLKYPKGLSVDSQGNLYIADSLNHRVRKVSTSGTISTAAGSGTAGFSGDGGMAIVAQLNAPYDVCAASGSIFFSDLRNYRVRKTQSGSTGCGCDVNGDGSANVADVQLIINQALGIASATCDVNGDGAVNIADVQKVINAALGLGCN